MQAEVSFQEADFSDIEFGELECEAAVAAFKSMDWQEKIAAFDAANSKNDACPPCFMVTFGNQKHLSLSVYSDGVEVTTSMPAISFLKKLLNMSDDTMVSVTIEEVPALIRRAFEDFQALHESLKIRKK